MRDELLGESVPPIIASSFKPIREFLAEHLLDVLLETIVYSFADGIAGRSLNVLKIYAKLSQNRPAAGRNSP
jgi:hypothetical protein